MRVKLSSMPDPAAERTVTFSGLWGGLNLREDPQDLGSRQSPEMWNLWYRDGVLRGRDGTETVYPAEDGETGDGAVWFHDRLFHGQAVYVCGTAIRYFDPDNPGDGPRTVAGTKIAPDTGHGTFFTFDDRLYYKAPGTYLRLRWEGGTLKAENILWQTESGAYSVGSCVYRPVVAVNRSPDGSGGSLYQPENRISPEKEVWFDIDGTSHEYLLPVHGCRVTEIRLEDDSVDTSAGTNRTFLLGGRQVEILGEKVSDSSSQFTRLRFSAPLYVDDTGWTTQDHTETPSTGSNFLKNVRYSTFDIAPNEDTEFRNGTVLRTKDQAMPEWLTETFLSQALARCPCEDTSRYFVLDNGVYMNLFVMGGAFAVDKYDSETTEAWMSDYYRVSYRYADGSWSSADYRGRSETAGWHYLKNAVCASAAVTCGGATLIPKGYAKGGFWYNRSFQSLAEEYLGRADRTLLWVSRNEELVVFHYLVGTQRFHVTAWDGDCFKGRGVTMVTLHRRDLDWRDVTVATGSGGGFYLKNIVYAGQELSWYGAAPGDPIVPKTGGDVPQDLGAWAEIALYRARRDCPDISGDYAVAVSGRYVTVYVDAGMDLKTYDASTGEFTASGFIAQRYVMPEDDLGLDFSTPAVRSNKLRVVYEKWNPEALTAIAQCRYASEFGGTDGVCAVLGGCQLQPNAIFWSGNGSSGVDATYFPMDQYNLCGAYETPITGFGRQQSVLAVFQAGCVSKAAYSLTEIRGRKSVNLTLSTVNARRGCDLPWTVRLCGNRLVWLHSHYGALMLRDATAAGETAVTGISETVNGSEARPGLLADISNGTIWDTVAAEDGRRYYAFAGGRLYVWDYSLDESLEQVSWTRHGPFHPQAAAAPGLDTVYLLGADGALSRLRPGLETDGGVPFRCLYRTPTLGDGHRLRRVVRAVCALGSGGGRVTVRFGGEGADSAVYEPRFPDRPRSGEFLDSLVLRPRGLRNGHFYLQIEGPGSLRIGEIRVGYTAWTRHH